jgi:hypothetical protein
MTHDESRAVHASPSAATDVSPALRDAVATATYAYDEAVMAYEDALLERDSTSRAAAEARLQEATRILSLAQAALASARRPERVSFADLLNDPCQQLDGTGEILASVLAYQSATPAAASGAPSWYDRAPAAVRRASFVYQQVSSSTQVATAS